MLTTHSFAPKRIICLTEEPTELLYLLGEQDRIVGISGFTRRPRHARHEKPKVCTFLDAKIDVILDLQPDLVIGFSDLQADIAQQLIKNGVTVWINNYRSVQGIINMMWQLGVLVEQAQKTQELIADIQQNIAQIAKDVAKWPMRPKVYSEEWHDPIITSIQWFAQIIELAGGIDVFSEFSSQSLAKNRIVEDAAMVIAKNPDIIIASWCGQGVKKEKIISRPNWQQINAVKNGQIFEVKSETILQPGPAALMEALPEIHTILQNWVNKYAS